MRLSILSYAYLLAVIFVAAAERTKLGNFLNKSHNVKGVVYMTDEDTLEIMNFRYDGVGPDAFFYVGKEGTGVGPEGENIPYPGSEPGKPLGKHEASTIQLKLPKGYKRENLGWLSVWCKKFNVDFGHVSFLKKTQTTTPPPNPDDKYEDYSEEEVNKGSSSNLKVALIILYLTQMMIALLI